MPVCTAVRVYEWGAELFACEGQCVGCVCGRTPVLAEPSHFALRRHGAVGFLGWPSRVCRWHLVTVIVATTVTCRSIRALAPPQGAFGVLCCPMSVFTLHPLLISFTVLFFNNTSTPLSLLSILLLAIPAPLSQ
jgi:hypothetical protein